MAEDKKTGQSAEAQSPLPRNAPVVRPGPPRREKVKVKLKKPHTHECKKLDPGATIEVWPDQVEWLRERGII